MSRRGGQTGRVSVSTKIINDRGKRGVVSVLRRGGQTGRVSVSTKITRCKFTQKPRVANCVRVRRVHTCGCSAARALVTLG